MFTWLPKSYLYPPGKHFVNLNKTEAYKVITMLGLAYTFGINEIVEWSNYFT